MFMDDPCGNCDFSHSFFDDMIGMFVDYGGGFRWVFNDTGGASVLDYRATLGVFTDPLWVFIRTTWSPFGEP